MLWLNAEAGMNSSDGHMLTPLPFDQIAAFDSWPSRLIGMESFSVREKTRSEVIREFDTEKWGELLAGIRKNKFSDIHAIERAYSREFGIFPCMKDGDFYLSNYLTMNEYHLEIYERILAPLVGEDTVLVELGAGYGSKILQIADRNNLPCKRYIAGELSRNGCEVIRRLAEKGGFDIHVGEFDFYSPGEFAVDVPENAVFYTSYAAHYIPEIGENLVNELMSFKPAAVVHFEPCYELHDTQSVYGLMCKKYIELNDYNRNLYGVLSRLDGKKLKLENLGLNVLGSNPFLPISVLKWGLP